MSTELTYLLNILERYKNIHGDKPLTILSLILFIQGAQEQKANHEQIIYDSQDMR